MTNEEFDELLTTDPVSKRMWYATTNLVEQCHADNEPWWFDPRTGEDLRDTPLVFPVRMMQVVTELSEAVEGHRKGLRDPNVPDMENVAVECADALIRLCDACGAMGIDIARAVVLKRLFNKHRADHKAENRIKEGGKAY